MKQEYDDLESMLRHEQPRLMLSAVFTVLMMAMPPAPVQTAHHSWLSRDRDASMQPPANGSARSARRAQVASGQAGR